MFAAAYPPPLFVKIGKIPQFFSIAKTGKPGGGYFTNDE